MANLRVFNLRSDRTLPRSSCDVTNLEAVTRSPTVKFKYYPASTGGTGTLLGSAPVQGLAGNQTKNFSIASVGAVSQWLGATAWVGFESFDAAERTYIA